MAAGRVATGFSLAWVAKYSATGTTVTYTNGMRLGRSVDVTLSPETSDNEPFYADNIAAETPGAIFTGGTVSLTIDGLKDAVRQLIMGTTSTESVTVGSSSVTVYVDDDDTVAPYVGIGFVVRYMEAGVTSYVPVVLTKAQFNIDELSAATQENEIEFQTQTLEANLMRDDSAKHAWRKIGAEQTTETLAEAVVKALLDVT